MNKEVNLEESKGVYRRVWRGKGKGKGSNYNLKSKRNNEKEDSNLI